MEKTNESTIQDLEKQKLILEIHELKKPLYRRTAFFAIIGPTALAAGSLALGYYTGLFEVQKAKLENSTILLEIERNKIEAQLASEREVFESERELITNEMSEIRAELIDEKERIGLERSELIAEFNKRKEEINKEKIAMEEKLKNLEIQIEQKNEELEEVPIRELVRSLGEDRQINPYSNASRLLIKNIKEFPKYTRIVESSLPENNNPILHVNLLYVLALATGNHKYREDMFQFIMADDNANVDNIMGVIGHGNWDQDPENWISVLKFVVKIAKEGVIGKRNLGEALAISAHASSELIKSAQVKLDHAEKSALLKLGLKVAFDPSSHSAHRSYAAQTVGIVVPDIFPVLLGSLLVDESIGKSGRDVLKAEVMDMLERKVPQADSSLYARMTIEDFPDPYGDGVAAWLERVENSRIGDLIKKRDIEGLLNYE